ncbi:MAG: hypothetical protein J0M15_08795 [Deltaproteobacteria bacterium]|nr:hypothetical protein [Deltaproteobacteria bacterium]
MELKIPFKVLTASVDNGNEFLNNVLIDNFGSEEIRGKNTIKIQRGGPNQKNDQCYVEQKNYIHVSHVPQIKLT